MTKWIQLSVLSIMLAAGASTAHAKKERCKAYVDGDWELIGKTFTDGGCSLEAKRRVGPKLCTDGSKKFEFKYMFDGKITHGEGWCNNYK